MGKMVGAIAAVLVGLALATGVAVAVSSASAPDKGVNLNEPGTPNNFGGGRNTVNYGTAP
ncbi:hypothetical protein GCM10027436_71150 [Actinophytocola sediminis]